MDVNCKCCIHQELPKYCKTFCTKTFLNDIYFTFTQSLFNPWPIGLKMIMPVKDTGFI